MLNTAHNPSLGRSNAKTDAEVFWSDAAFTFTTHGSRINSHPPMIRV